MCPWAPTSTREASEARLTRQSGVGAQAVAAGALRFTLRPACPADATALSLVHARAIRALAATHYTPAELEAWANRMRPEDYVETAPTRQRVVAEIATADGPRVVGYGQLHVVEGTVEAIYVDPAFARQGVGAALLAALEREGRGRGLPGLIVEASLNSVPFYGAQGFVARGLDHHTLAPGVSIACAVMEKRLTPVRE